MAWVLLGHVLVWLVWQAALAPHRQRAQASTQAPLVWLDLRRPVTPPPPPPATAAVEAIPARPIHRPAPAPHPPQPPTTESTWVQVPAPPVRPESAPAALAPEPPASTAPAPRERLLDTAASREALRQLARQPLLSERAAQASGQAFHTGAQRMADAASAAGKGNCAQGNFVGGGMGLLSLPFLAAAVATGECAK